MVTHARAEDAAAAARMSAAVAFADAHAASEDWFGALDPEIAAGVEAEELTRLREGKPGRTMGGPGGIETELRLAGQGCFAVTEFAVTELAAALSMSEHAARAYVGQSIELRDRLPRCWDQVMAGRLAAWKARQVAERTIPLAAATAAWVDSQLAPFAHKISLARVLACVEAAVLRFEPELAAQRAEATAEKRGVWVEDRVDGTSTINGVAVTPDAIAFDHALNQVATALGELGDTDPRQVRRAKAVGVLADPQYALDLAKTSSDTDNPASDVPSPAPERDTPRSSNSPTVHIHLHAAAVTGVGAAGVGAVGGVASAMTLGPVARVEAPGRRHPVSTSAIRLWLRELAPGTEVKVSPVIDLDEHISLDAYEVPTRLADQIAERDLCCVFPWCGNRGRYDLDHRDAYQFDHPDRPGTGPPKGQTSTDKLHRLCRFHHRVKTHDAWTYLREPDASLTWTSPLLYRYRVDHSGTTRLA